MDENIIQELKEIKETLQSIASTLERKEKPINFSSTVINNVNTADIKKSIEEIM